MSGEGGRFGCTLFAPGCIVLAPVGVCAEAVADAPEQMIEAYGGEENVHNLDSNVQEGDPLALTRRARRILHPARRGTHVLQIVFPAICRAPGVNPQQPLTLEHLVRSSRPAAARIAAAR